MKTLLAAMLICIFTLSACTSAERSKIQSLGTNHHVRLFSSDGKVIGEWWTDGITHNEENSDGLYFTDSATGKLVRIEGTIIDEQETSAQTSTPSSPTLPGDTCKTAAQRANPNDACRFGGVSHR